MNIQLDAQNRLRHFLAIEGLSREHLLDLIQLAGTFISEERLVRIPDPMLRGKAIATLFVEPSTRTLCSFELAAKRLGANVINLDMERSSTTKGETLVDTALMLIAMGVDLLVMRHPDDNVPEQLAQALMDKTIIVNGGDGMHAHPTQAMLDIFTMHKHFGRFDNLSVAIVGDIMHSRVARSEVHALLTLGVPDVRLVGPEIFIPDDMRELPVKVFMELDEGIRDVDVVFLLRIQHERISEYLNLSRDDYHSQFGLTVDRLKYAKPNALVMHPGPMNRGVEVDTLVADCPQSVIVEQVRNGVAMRMAIMQRLLI